MITEKHLNIIALAAFDWLIGAYKVAPKAYSMTILLLLGKKILWICPELQLILTQNCTSGSAAYKARKKMTKEAIEKTKRV